MSTEGLMIISDKTFSWESSAPFTWTEHL